MQLVDSTDRDFGRSEKLRSVEIRIDPLLQLSTVKTFANSPERGAYLSILGCKRPTFLGHVEVREDRSTSKMKSGNVWILIEFAERSELSLPTGNIIESRAE